MSVEGSRFAHAEGRTCLVYRGTKVCTIGMDGEMRVWAGIGDDDCENISLGEEALALAVSNERMFVSIGETNHVTALNFDGENDGIITKFTADVTCLDTTDSGDIVLAGSADMTIKVTNTSTFSDKLFKGHQGPILSVSLDPKKKYCASSCCDGTVKVWDISEKKEVYSVDCIPKSNDVTTSKTVCGLRFSRSGAMLAIPKKGEVSVLARESWQEKTVLAADKLADGEMLTCLDFTHNDEWIIAGTSKGNICIWSLEDKSYQFVTTERKYNITALACHPSNVDEVSFADSQGHWSALTEVTTNSGGGIASQVSNQDNELLSQDELDQLFNQEDEDENSFSISKIQQSTGFLKDEEGHLIHEKSTILAGDPGGDLGSSRPVTPSSEQGVPVQTSKPRVVQAEVRLQPTFQPASSPDHFSYRFLVYNSVGLVKTIEDSNIVVEFHDNDTHHSEFFNNTDNYSMAALTDKILILGREGDEEAPGKINVINFKASGDKSWTVEIPEEEYVDGVAAGEGWVAVATSKNNLRIFSAWGVQREIISVAGSFVSLVGTADKLFVVFHESTPLPKQHFLGYYIIDVDLRKGLNSVHGPKSLPVSPRADLFWIGMSDTMLPTTADSHGIVRILIKNCWYVISDTKSQMKGKADNFFVTCIDHTDKKIRGIKCRGAKYPTTLPSPTMTSINMELPFCISGERGGHEQTLMQATILASALEESSREAQESRAVERQYFMRLFALALMSDHEQRALELCKLMPDLELVQTAIRFATQKKKTSIVPKLGEIAMELQDAELNRQQQEDQQRNGGRQAEEEEDEDMFEATQPLFNPLIRAGMQAKQNQQLQKTTSLLSNKSTQENRNPFAKKAEKMNGSIECSPGSGIVFDNPATKQPMQRKKVLIQTKKKPLISTENKSRSDGEELKGFQLYLAENKEMFPGTQEQSQESALQAWKSLDKSEKEEYKMPRLPGCKRKRSEDDTTNEDNEKKSKLNFKSKLSAFSFGSS